MNQEWFEKEVSQLPEKVAVEVMKCFEIVEEYKLQTSFYQKTFDLYKTQKAENPSLRFLLAYDSALDQFHL